MLFASKRGLVPQETDEGWVELRTSQSRVIGFIVVAVLSYVVIKYLLLVQVR